MKCFKKQQSTGSAGRTAPAFIRGVRCVMGVEPIILFIILFGVHFHASVIHIVLSNFKFHQIYLTLFFELIDNYFLISITIDPHLLCTTWYASEKYHLRLISFQTVSKLLNFSLSAFKENFIFTS